MAKNQRDFFKKKNEWSEIKDTLLRCYLPQYFQKLLVSGKPIFYIDCFAGKGKFDDGNDGSPLIAMQIINERLGMSRISRKNNAIVPCFIELNHAADLEQNLMLHPYQYGTPQVVDGKFEDNIRGLLKDKRGYNVFLYIDPYGIQALDSQLFDEIGTYGFRSFEMLINFNSFGFFRDACRVMKVDISQDDALMGLDDLVEYEPTTVTASPQSENLLTRIAGGNYWMDIVRDFQMGRIDGYQAERRLSAEYKQHLKQKYKYVLDNGACWRYQQDQMLEIMRGWCGCELRDLNDAHERAVVCGVPESDVRQGVQAIVLSESLEISAQKAQAVYSGVWHRHFPQILCKRSTDTSTT